MKRKLYEAGLIILFYLLQVTLVRNISIGGIAPNFMIILPCLFGYLNGRREGMYMGFLSGILYDLYFSDLLGFSALIFTLIGYFCGMLCNRYSESNFTVPVVLLSGSVFVYEFLVFIGNFLFQNRLIFSYFLTRIILPEIIYTVIVGLLLYKPFELLNRYLNKRSGKVNKADEKLL